MSIGLSSLRLNIGDIHQGELQHLQDELIALSDDVRHISHSYSTMLHELGLQAALGGLSNLDHCLVAEGIKQLLVAGIDPLKSSAT